MINVDDELKLLFVNVLKGLNLRSDIEFTIEHPADPVNGDYAVNVAMILFADSQINYRELTKPKAGTAHAVCCNARIIKALYKSPRMLADAIVAELSKNLPKYMKKIEVAGPGFINIYLTGQFFIDSVVELGSGNISFVPKDYSSKNISLEHTQINPNKEPHIGHLRNASIGDSLTKILRATGDNVKVQYYQNDIGQQIASIILAYKKQFIPYSGSFIDGSKKLLEWASMAYVDIESRYETDSDLKAEKEAIHIQIAMSGSEISKLAREITDGILKATLEIFGSLDIEYDLIVRESDILKNKLWEDTFKLLKKNDKFYLAKDGDKKGCWLVNMPDDEDKVIVRSNGIPTYAGNDIAYHLWKFGVLKDFKYLKLDWDTQSGPLYVTSTDESGSVMNEFSSADEIVNIIDISQTYPQNSVKQALNVLGYSDLAKHYKHVNYGFVFLSIASADELGIEHSKLDKVIKMSGRKGSVISINEFIDLLRTKLELEHGGFDSIDDVIKGALKFEMLKYDTYQDVVFDISSAVDQKGFSSAYIQYTRARANSVLIKGNYDKTDLILENYEFNESEYSLIRELYKYPEVVNRCAQELAPHYLCQYLFGLSKLFNGFYNSCQIIGSSEQKMRMALVNSTSCVLKNGLSLLGIKSPDSL